LKKLFIVFTLILVLFGCSKEDKVTNTESLSLEEQITSVMSENKLRNKEIIDYDIKDNFVYVIFKNKHESSNSHNPDLVILENSDGKLEWVAGPDDRTITVDNAGIFGRDDGPSVTIILPDENARDTKIKEIKVLGESAKVVTYVEHFTNDFSKQYMYWIAYTNEEPTADDIEVIME
jgi:hypothetical protein